MSARFESLAVGKIGKCGTCAGNFDVHVDGKGRAVLVCRNHGCPCPQIVLLYSDEEEMA